MPAGLSLDPPPVAPISPGHREVGWPPMTDDVYGFNRACLYQSIPDPISSYIMGPCTCTETMALNGYINICIIWQEFSNWSPIYSLG